MLSGLWSLVSFLQARSIWKQAFDYVIRFYGPTIVNTCAQEKPLFTVFTKAFWPL